MANGDDPLGLTRGQTRRSPYQDEIDRLTKIGQNPLYRFSVGGTGRDPFGDRLRALRELDLQQQGLGLRGREIGVQERHAGVAEQGVGLRGREIGVQERHAGVAEEGLGLRGREIGVQEAQEKRLGGQSEAQIDQIRMNVIKGATETLKALQGLDLPEETMTVLAQQSLRMMKFASPVLSPMDQAVAHDSATADEFVRGTIQKKIDLEKWISQAPWIEPAQVKPLMAIKAEKGMDAMIGRMDEMAAQNRVIHAQSGLQKLQAVGHASPTPLLYKDALKAAKLTPKEQSALDEDLKSGKLKDLLGGRNIIPPSGPLMTESTSERLYAGAGVTPGLATPGQVGTAIKEKQAAELQKAAMTGAAAEAEKRKLPLTPKERGTLVDPAALEKSLDLVQPPSGMSMQDAIAKKFVDVDDKQKEKVRGLKNTRQLLDDLFRMADATITATDPAQAMVQRGQKPTEAFFKSNPAAAAYRDASTAFLGNVAREIGSERGVLTNQDIERSARSLPKFSDTVQVKEIKKALFNNLLEAARHGVVGEITGRSQAGVKQRIQEILDKLEKVEAGATERAGPKTRSR